MAISLFFILLYILMKFYDPPEIFLVNNLPLYVFWTLVWVGFFAPGFFMVASFNIERKSTQMFLRVFSYFILGYFIFTSILYFIPYDIQKSDGTVNENGICFQRTSYSCGPCSMVMLLDQYNIDSTEGEMAKLSYTFPVTGVNDAGMIHALRRKTKDTFYKPVAEKVKIDDLKKFDKPVVTAVKLDQPLLNHAVVVESFNGKKFVVLDPLKGRVLFSESELKRRWLEVVIYLERKKF